MQRQSLHYQNYLPAMFVRLNPRLILSIKSLASIFLFSLTMESAYAVDISAAALKIINIGANNLSSGAGSDLTDPLNASPFTLVIQNASGPGGATDYAVFVKKSLSYNLPGTITVKVRRSSGAEEITVGDVNTEFFQDSGNGGHSVIVILENASITTLPPNSYNADLIFSISELP